MRIGIFDPDPVELNLIRHSLERSGFECEGYADGAGLEAASLRRRFDALVIDCRGASPEDPSLRVVAAVSSDIATLAMVSGAREEDIIAALSAGADDYLVKPIRPSELVARLQALLRRAYPHETRERFEFAPFHFCPDDCAVVVSRVGGPGTRAVEDDRVALTQKEFDLALVLFRNAGRPLSRNHIRELVWGGEADVSSRTMDTHVSRLRTKLGLGPERGFRVMPVYGYGYRLDALER